MIHVYAKSILTMAANERLIPKSPFVKIKAPEVRKKPLNLPSTKKVLAMAEAMPSRYRALILCAATTGMRQGELFGLTWDRVMRDTDKVDVNRQLIGVVEGMPRFGPLKTKASYRQIPLAKVALEALDDHRSRFAEGPEGLVFTNQHGAPLRRQALEFPFNAALQKIDAMPSAKPSMTRKVPKSMTFHTLRHYYASLLIHSGESVKSVQEMLGHQSATETLDTYGHLWPGADDRVRAAIDNEFGDQVWLELAHPLAGGSGAPMSALRCRMRCAASAKFSLPSEHRTW
ncbi:tyrosine-type recombinase/integrase [Demequina sp.]|uniref:tyrosine-type recombinase/integrase n=1 Tax=Demequina sp. TaxID=2050685 RepID=UPI003A88C42C